jgi:glycosyltransferase involved in cell wall biosynthesis
LRSKIGQLTLENDCFRKRAHQETGTSYVNVGGETGIVIPPENPGELAQAMNRLLVDQALAQRFGRAARQRYEKLFSGEALGRAYAELYQEVAGAASVRS